MTHPRGAPEWRPSAVDHLLLIMLREGSVMPRSGECDAARALVAKGWASWSSPLRIVPTASGRWTAQILDEDLSSKERKYHYGE